MPTPEYFERKNAYIRRYKSKTYTNVSIVFRKDSEEEMALANFVRSKPSATQFIKQLIKEAMDAENDR